jgi:hypothetical protein
VGEILTANAADVKTFYSYDLTAMISVVTLDLNAITADGRRTIKAAVSQPVGYGSKLQISRTVKGRVLSRALNSESSRSIVRGVPTCSLRILRCCRKARSQAKASYLALLQIFAFYQFRGRVVAPYLFVKGASSCLQLILSIGKKPFH